MELKTVAYEIYPQSDREHAITTRSKTLANRINRLLKYYDNGEYMFQLGEEPVFRFDNSKLADILLIVAPRMRR